MSMLRVRIATAYFYSVAVVFFPDVLPVAPNERESGVIIAFVLLNKYMEKTAKRRFSAAIQELMNLRPAVAHVIRDGVETDPRRSERG